MTTDGPFNILSSSSTRIFCLWCVIWLLSSPLTDSGALIQGYFVSGMLYDYWGALLQDDEFQYKDILSVVYIMTTEESFYRLRNSSLRIICLWCITWLLQSSFTGWRASHNMYGVYLFTMLFTKFLLTQISEILIVNKLL